MMGTGFSRRRTLKVLAATAAIPLAVAATRTLRVAPKPFQWNGEALGALSSITLWTPHPAKARAAFARMAAEVARLENVFSLYLPESEVSRLNREGELYRPSRDLRLVLDESLRIAEASSGAFDPTVQPLWKARAAGIAPSRAILQAVDYEALNLGKRRVSLDKPGMAVSLNGIAQGYITDWIADLLRNEGFENAVVELGETRTLGAMPDGSDFEIGLTDPLHPGSLREYLQITDAALSVSGGYGLPFAPGQGHHILNPKSGFSPETLSQVAVIAPTAMQADGLSTAIYVAGAEAAGTLLSGVPGARAILADRHGEITKI